MNLVVIISKEILCEDEPYMTFQVPNSTSSSGLPGILRIRMVRTFHITTLTSDYISNAVDPYSHGALAALNILRISKLILHLGIITLCFTSRTIWYGSYFILTDVLLVKIIYLLISPHSPQTELPSSHSPHF